MSESAPRFPEYGDGGDCIGARRVRHAFRWCVVLCASFAVLLWMTERFFRYPHAERLYLSAITKPAEQARVFLRQAVVYDEKKRDIPTPKYLQALAVVEEEDTVLPSFEKALKADPGNWALGIQYGCRLFANGRAAEAQTQFQLAAENAPENSLPLYLEAAVLPWTAEGEDGLRKALALIARANSTADAVSNAKGNTPADAVVFPRPLWSSDLPVEGEWHAHLSREMVTRCADPLYRFIDMASSRANEQLEDGRTQQWDTWLGHIETMGRHIAAAALPAAGGTTGKPAAGAATQAHVGLSIQLFALKLRERIAEMESTGANEARIKKRIRIETAIEQILQFENERDGRIEAARVPYRLPGHLCIRALALLLAAYLAAFTMSKLMGAGGVYATVSHSSSARRVLTAAGVTMFAVLTTVTILQTTGVESSAWMMAMRVIWWAALIPALGFGIVYPYIALPGLRQTCEAADANPADEDVIRFARAARRRAAGSLLRRYFGVALGLALCAMSLWVLEYRVAMTLYPWQTNLLVTGLADEEAQVVRGALKDVL